MIGVFLEGRLGNQLFQYAFAFNTSRKLKTDFFLEDSNQVNLLKNYFDLKNYNYFQARVKQFKLKLKSTILIDIDHSKPYVENKNLANKNNCYYKGFFQSEFYFQEFKQQIKEEFNVKKKHQIDVRKYLGITNNKPLVVLHVRRTDYLVYGDDRMGGKDLSLPLDYYNSCLSKIDQLENYNVVFVTDDTQYVQTHFGNYNPIVSSDKNPIVDFQVLLAGDILIVANSSFSWWGGYLNVKNARVFAPKYWLGFMIKKEYPCNVIPETWEQIEF